MSHISHPVFQDIEAARPAVSPRALPSGFVWGSRIVCCCSVTQPCLTFCDPMDCSVPDFPVLHYLLGLAQTHVH